MHVKTDDNKLSYERKYTLQGKHNVYFVVMLVNQFTNYVDLGILIFPEEDITGHFKKNIHYRLNGFRIAFIKF